MITPPGSEYAPVIKGDSAMSNLEQFAFAAMNPVAQAASTFTGQNVGVKDYRRVRKVLGTSCLISVVVALAVSTLLLVFSDPLLALYGVQNADDFLAKTAYETAITRLLWRGVPFFLISLMNTSAGVLRGVGKSITSAAISFVGTCVFRVVWIFTVFEYFKTLESIYVSYGITWIMTSTAFLIIIGVELRKKIKEQDAFAADLAVQHKI